MRPPATRTAPPGSTVDYECSVSSDIKKMPWIKLYYIHEQGQSKGFTAKVGVAKSTLE